MHRFARIKTSQWVQIERICDIIYLFTKIRSSSEHPSCCCHVAFIWMKHQHLQPHSPSLHVTELCANLGAQCSANTDCYKYCVLSILLSIPHQTFPSGTKASISNPIHHQPTLFSIILFFRNFLRNLVFAGFCNETLLDREANRLLRFRMLNARDGDLRVECGWRELHCHREKVIGSSTGAKLHCAWRRVGVDELNLPLKHVSHRIESELSWNDKPQSALLCVNFHRFIWSEFLKIPIKDRRAACFRCHCGKAESNQV